MFRRLTVIAFAAGLAAASFGCGERMPASSSEAYAEAVSSFYAGISSMQVGEDRRAEDHLLRVLELAPDEPAAWANLGLLALRRNELDLAVERLEEARELAPGESRIEFLLGRVEAVRGNAETAISHFERASELDPENVRALYALSEQVETYGGAGASERVRSLVDAILEIDPNNLAVLVERARLAAISGDQTVLRETIERFESFAAGWSEEAQLQLDAVVQSAEMGDLEATTTELTFLSNVLKREPSYRESLASVSTQAGQTTELIGRLLALPEPENESAPPDEGLVFAAEERFEGMDENAWRWMRAVVPSEEASPILLAAAGDELVFEDGTRLSTPGPLHAQGLIVTDYDYDFAVDLGLAGPNGFRLLRSAEGDAASLVDVTDELGLSNDVLTGSYAAGWTADVDMEGDLDLILARSEGPPLVLRNNGDRTFSVRDPFGDVTAARGFLWSDLDGDGDPDAVFVESSGRVHFYENNRSQGFARRDVDASAHAATVADLNKDGIFELVMLLHGGEIVSIQAEAGGDRAFTRTLGSFDVAGGEDARLFAADLDNNGDADLLASSGGRAVVFLSGSGAEGVARLANLEGDIYALADIAGSGRLDPIGVGATPARFENRGSMAYNSTSLRPLAAEATGDQRINPFGIGGEVEVRSGLLYAKQPITEPVVHFGLGEREMVDVARIVWPNGDIQAEFDLRSNETVQARQRLKGSCPWLFAFDGEGMAFVTDFIWRSPLGLRINAQETAGVMMTEDWVKVEGSELRPKDGHYDLRITAELWETHFFDHISLIVVDHPEDTEIFVDERFAFPPPPLAIQATGRIQPVSRVTDDSGRDVTELVAVEDDRYLASFERGPYQGVAEEHSIEIDLRDAPSEGPLRLLASGWVRPTDSSINVAISQGSHPAPSGLRLEVPDGRGGWTTVHPNLGFPAGKYKTIVVDLSGIFPAEQIVRLTTNLEIYWDAISWAPGLPDAELRTSRLEPARADLRYRGYSEVVTPDRTHPEVPLYDELASSVQIWQDLEGYYTRFGDVRTLLRGVDDRYVIMNAGDELLLEFPVPEEPPPGWKRDFVLVGDGWVKDGDFNTAYSETVRPLPAHDLPEYEGRRGALEDDPVYRRHPDDWRSFHTRYVTNEVLR